jgi:hypothetical protein
MQFFPHFFLLYFLFFHIYFFSYTYGTYISGYQILDIDIVLHLTFEKLIAVVLFLYDLHLFTLLPGFSYLAFSAMAAFMQHLILYFWNRFEVSLLVVLVYLSSLLSEACYPSLLYVMQF